MQHSNGSTVADRNAPEVVFDGGGVRIHDRPSGYFWRPKGTKREYGPFLTMLDALDDVERRVGADVVGDAEDWLGEIGYESAFAGSGR